MPTLIVHGDDDQIVPIEALAYLSSKIAPQATLKVYAGAPHGLPITHQEQLNADLLAFLKSRVRQSVPTHFRRSGADRIIRIRERSTQMAKRVADVIVELCRQPV